MTRYELFHSEDAQGATEYILLLVVVTALVIIFRPQIEDYFIEGPTEGYYDRLSNPATGDFSTGYIK